MRGPSRRYPEGALSQQIIGHSYDVYNELGYGFLESVYVSALELVLRENAILVVREQTLDVVFHGCRIGTFRADLIVEGRLILEIKAGPLLPRGAKSQLCNYLKISGIPIGLLLHFGPSPEVSRAVMGPNED